MYSTPGKPLPERPRPSGNLPNLPHLKSARKSLFGLSLVNDFSQDLDEQENSSNNNTFETPIARSSMKQKVTFAHDPDLDSTPFVYIRHTKSESSDSPLITNSRNRQTPALNVEPAVDMLSTRFSNINMEASTTNITNPSEEDEDLFGLGAFSDNFISESEIEASAQKLGEEERRSQAKVHSEYTQLLGEWAVENAIDSSVFPLSSRCRICVNFVIIGVGQLMFHQQTLHWSGNTIDGQACFGFPSIIECKPKCLNGELPMIILSLQHNRSIQFQFEDLDEQKVEEISKTIKCNETQQQQQQSLTSE